MKRNIAEELPSRKHSAPVVAAKKEGGEKKETDPAKKAKQAVYDIRYRARREELPLRQAYSQYLQNSTMSQQERELVKSMLFGKSGMKEDYQIRELLSTKFDRETLVELLQIDKFDIDEVLRNCSYSESFILSANDLQILQAISQCYEEFKLLKRK